MSNWIRCSERMPDGEQNVIAFDGDVLDGITFEDGVFTSNGYDPFDRVVVENITHWQPLPEPPKEGE